jgi:hypothetical protein
MTIVELICGLAIIALGVFLFLLPAKLLVVVAQTAQPDVRDQVVKNAERWFAFAKVSAVLVPLVVVFLIMGRL